MKMKFIKTKEINDVMYVIPMNVSACQTYDEAEDDSADSVDISTYF